MTTTSSQPWRCLRGHENPPHQRRCERCHLPRWVNGYTLGVAGAVLLIGLGYGIYSLSAFLKHWQYQSLVKQVWADKTVTAAERQELGALQTYLGLTDEQARRLEAEISGQLEAEISGQIPAPSREIKPPPAPSVAEALQRIQEDLEQGRLSAARQAIATLSAQQPIDEAITRLKQAIEQTVKGRIEVKVPGATSGHHILDATEALLVLQGTEGGFRFYVEPHETVYFYLYSVDSAGKVRVLFPTTQPEGGGSNPLASQGYWLPAQDSVFPLASGGNEVKEVVMVTSRWPARELEQAGAGLAGESGEAASRRLRDAVQARKAAQIGGCDVRTVQFAR